MVLLFIYVGEIIFVFIQTRYEEPGFPLIKATEMSHVPMGFECLLIHIGRIEKPGAGKI